MRAAAVIAIVLAGGLAHAAAPEKDQEKLVAAMAGFTQAMKTRDTKHLLKYFPRKGTWSWAPTRNPSLNYGDGSLDPPSKHTYAQLKAGLGKGGEFHEQLFEVEDCLYTVFEINDFKPWELKSENTFVPRGYGPAVYVRWRKENGRFVVDQIGTPET